MKFLVYFTFYCWDNHQGGSGKYIDTKLIFEAPVGEEDVWSKIHDNIKKFLSLKRPFDQTVYSKNEGEYFIQKVELL